MLKITTTNLKYIKKEVNKNKRNITNYLRPGTACPVKLNYGF